MRFLKQSVYCLIFFILILYLNSCQSKIKYFSPPGYDLEHPRIILLAQQDLNEISGIVYYPKDTSVFAISDESGYLFKIFPDRNKTLVQKWKFGINHDYEDLQLVDSTFYILASNGNIVGVTFSKTAPMKVDHYTIDNQKNEFESLYYDSTLNALILVCKNCKKDKKANVSTASFDITSGTYKKGPYKIDVKKITALAKIDKEKFKPSAAAINPLTHELYILSSVNKQLVIADSNGNPQQVYALRPSIYNQPEGIAFTPRGDLLISNEAAGKHGSGNILVIKHKN